MIDYEEIYRGRPPWEIGGPQPALARVLGEAKGPAVLDAGCGTGELALALARQGHRVTGVDVSATAIGQARAKAAEAGLTVDFKVQDATRLALPPASFDSIFDSGLLHSLVRFDAGADAYLALLPRLAAPGATVFVLAVAVDAEGNSWGITEELLRAGFAEPAWTGTTIEESEAFAEVDGERLRHEAFLLRSVRAPLGVRTP